MQQSRIETISSGKIDFDRLGFINRADAREDKLLKAGDILFSNINSLNFIGNCAQFFGESILYAGMNLLSLRPKEFVHARWLFWLVRSNLFRAEVESRAKPAINQASISQGSVLAILICHPPICEQAEIADFIDRETAKIDALIAEQEKLIALLAEKRQATISRAVTRGLDPNVPLKDSGVPWLGKVPAHWDCLKLRRIADSVQTGGTPTSEQPSVGLENSENWFTPGDFSGELRLVESVKKVSKQAVEQGDVKMFPAESVLIVSIGATLGKVGFLESPSSANQQINAVVPRSGVSGYFLAYALSAKADEMRFLSNASTIGIMNQEKTKEIWVSVPSLAEQQAISDFLDKKLPGIESLTKNAERSIELLRERRSALISAAVTGKIDVRGLTA